MTANNKWVNLSKLEKPSHIVIHVGHQVSDDAEIRAVIQRGINAELGKDDLFGLEPAETLAVSKKHIVNLPIKQELALKGITKRVTVRLFGETGWDALAAVVRTLREQAPNAELWIARDGTGRPEPWKDMPAIVDELMKGEQAFSRLKLPLSFGFDGYDLQVGYLVKGLLPAESTCALFGPSGHFKSFLALSIGCHVATGMAWDGRRTEKGAVLYIVGEGGVGVRRRIKAWADHYGFTDMPNIARIDMPVFMADPSQISALKEAADAVEAQTGEPVRLIVVDTVARCFGGADENRAQDMGAFIAGSDRIKAETGASILLVHHTGKNEDAGARGSSAFRAALDAEFMVKREGNDVDAITLLCTKMKDDEGPAKRAYDLKSSIVCHDDDGDEVTSLVLIDTGRKPVEPDELDGIGYLTSNHKAMYQTIRTQCELLDGKVPWGQVIEHMKVANTWDSKKGTRWRDKLVDDGLIIWGEQAKVVSMPDKPE